MAALTQAFFEALPKSRAQQLDRDAVGRTLDDAVAQVRERYPDLATDVPRFVVRLAEIASDESVEWTALQFADLYLANACAEGDEAACAHFVAEFGPQVDRMLTKAAGRADATERRQLALAKILAPGQDAPPKIAGYRGRGRLGAWVRTVAARIAVDLLRQKKPNTSGPLDPDALPASGKSLPGQLAAAHTGDVQVAIAEALGDLSDDERRLLRLRFVDRLTTGQVATKLGVHRTTVARQVEQVREKVAELARAALRGRLVVNEATASSLMGMVGEGGLEVSIHRLLTSGANAGTDPSP